MCFPCICIKVHHLKLIKHNRNVKCTFAYEWWCFVCILRRTHWTWVLRGTSPGNFEYRTHHFFLLVTFINHTVCTFFFFEAVYIEIIFILKDNKTIESNELAILFNETLLFVCLWYEQIMYWTSHTVHILYLDSIVWVKSSFIIRVYNSWTTHLFFLGFTLLSSYVLFYLRHENTTAITI